MWKSVQFWKDTSGMTHALDNNPLPAPQDSSEMSEQNII